MAVVVLASRCPQNHRCPALRACPVGALRQAGVAAPTVDGGLCSDCGVCAGVCPTGALRMDGGTGGGEEEKK